MDERLGVSMTEPNHSEELGYSHNAQAFVSPRSARRSTSGGVFLRGGGKRECWTAWLKLNLKSLFDKLKKKQQRLPVPLRRGVFGFRHRRVKPTPVTERIFDRERGKTTAKKWSFRLQGITGGAITQFPA